jgi:hypothetical protein
MLASGTTRKHRYLQLQNWVGNGEPQLGGEVYVDDIFIQLDTEARVEIGDKSTWNACTKREVQVPISWNSSTIQARVNQGSFSNGETAYLYVVDSNGNVNNQGYIVTIGGENIVDNSPPVEEDPVEISPPKELRIVSTNS